MVKKLIKHEFIYYIRTLGMFMPIILAVGLVTRIFRILDNDSAITTIAVLSSYFALIVGSFAILFAPMVISVIRFYKNLFSSEGYLTLTLPVTNAQHILVKLLVSSIFSLLSFILVIIAVVIAFVSKSWGLVFAEIGRWIGVLFDMVPVWHMIFYIIEVVLILLISLLSGPLLYYACMAVGQMAKKNRILLAVGAYFIYYTASQTLATMALIMFSVLVEVPGVFDSVAYFIGAHPFAFVHILLVSLLIFTIVISAVFYFVTLRIMNRKLNLE